MHPDFLIKPALRQRHLRHPQCLGDWIQQGENFLLGEFGGKLEGHGSVGLDGVDEGDVVLGDEGQGAPAPAGTGGAAGAVDVVGDDFGHVLGWGGGVGVKWSGARRWDEGIELRVRVGERMGGAPSHILPYPAQHWAANKAAPAVDSNPSATYQVDDEVDGGNVEASAGHIRAHL